MKDFFASRCFFKQILPLTHTSVLQNLFIQYQLFDLAKTCQNVPKLFLQ